MIFDCFQPVHGNPSLYARTVDYNDAQDNYNNNAYDEQNNENEENRQVEASQRSYDFRPSQPDYLGSDQE